MTKQQAEFVFLNVGHFLDHYFLLIFATAALTLTTTWDLSYAELIPYATPGFIAFGLGAIPAGWLADRWSRSGMMVVFFAGIGSVSTFAAFATTPLEIGIAITFLGRFAAIYHPVGLAMVVRGRERVGVPLALNGVFGNLGVASAALLTGLLLDRAGWQAAFWLPGVLSILVGLVYWSARRSLDSREVPASESVAGSEATLLGRNVIRVMAVVLATTAIGGLIFQSTTFALPKVLDERLAELGTSASAIGSYAFVVFSVAALAQLVVGYLVDRMPIRRVLMSVALLQAVLFVVMMNLSGVAALLTATGFMLAVFGQIPINDVLVARAASSEWRSRAYAMRYVVTFSVMASALPLIAWVHANWGFTTLFGLLAVAAGLIAICSLALPREPQVAEETFDAETVSAR